MKSCIICDEPFTPRYNQPNQMTCGKSYCAHAWQTKKNKKNAKSMQETANKALRTRPGGFIVVRDPDVNAGLCPGLDLSNIEVEAMLDLRVFTVGTIIQSKSRQYIIEQENHTQVKRLLSCP